MTSFVQIPVRGGDHPDIHFDRPGAPQRLELLFLKHPQEFRLDGRAHLAHFVEEDRPPVGKLKPPLAAGNGAGEGALLMSEKLALEKRLRKGGAGDLDKRLPGPGAVVMDGVGHHLLPRPAFPHEQHRGVGGRHHGQRVQKTFHLRAPADDPGKIETVAQTFLENQVLRAEMIVLQRLFDQYLQFLDVQGFRQVIEGPRLERLHGRFYRGVGGHDQDGHEGTDFPDLGQRLDPVHVRHADVQQDEVKGLFFHGPDGFRAVGRFRHRISVFAQNGPQHDPMALFIVHDENFRFFIHIRLL